MIEEQVVKARACAIDFGYTSKGNDQMGVDFVLLEGENAGSHITWYGYFTEETFERTIESLRHMGWGGTDLAELPSNVPQEEVQLVIGHEEYNGEVYARVKWVNALGGIAMKERMDAGAARAFANKMKGRILALGAKSGQPRAAANGQRPTAPQQSPVMPDQSTDDIPF